MCSFCVGHLLALQALFLLRLRLPFSQKLLGSFSSWVFFFFFFPPFRWAGEEGGGLGVHLVFVVGCFLPSRSTLVWRGGAVVPLGICLSRAGSLLLLLLLREVGARELALLLQTPFPASPSLLTLPNSHRTFHDVGIRGCLQSLAPAFYPPASHALQSVARGWIRGLGHVRLALVDVAVALALSAYRSRLRGRERGGRSSSASRFSRGRSRCGRLRSSDRYRSQHGSSRSRRAWSRSSDRSRSRRDRSRRGRSRSFARYRSRRERARSHACRGVRRGRSRSPALPNRSRDRSRSSVRLPASPARLRSVEAGRLTRRGPQEGVEAFVSQPPVAWSSGGRPSCSGGASIAALPSVFAGACQVLHGLVWLLFLGSTWSLGGCDRFCSSVGGCRVPVFACCWGGHFLCCDCDACWGWRFACCSRCWSWRVW